MRITWLVSLGVFALSACGSQSAECGAAECADICAAQGTPAAEPGGGTALTLTDFEESLLGPVLEDVRAGVRPFAENSIGICRGTQNCEEPLGTDVGELPEGKYMIRAELEVPDVGPKGTWKVEFSTTCETIKVTANGENRTSNDYNRTFEVVHSRSERGFRLQPLRTIESPSPFGRRECSWQLKTVHPDNGQVFEGSWSVPGA